MTRNEPAPEYDSMSARVYALRSKFERQGAFFVYDLAEADQISLSMAPAPDHDPTREIVGVLVGRGVFRILEDRLAVPEWVGRELSFGTYAASHGPVNFDTSGILRGYIARGGAVTVDLAGRDFFNEGADLQYYPDVWTSLAVNGITFF